MGIDVVLKLVTASVVGEPFQKALIDVAMTAPNPNCQHSTTLRLRVQHGLLRGDQPEAVDWRLLSATVQLLQTGRSGNPQHARQGQCFNGHHFVQPVVDPPPGF